MNGKKYVYNISIPAMCFLIFVFAPIEMYLMIKKDTWFSLKDFAGYLSIFFIVSVIFGLLIDRLMYKFIPNIWDRIVFFVFSVFLALYIQGNYIKADYGVLNGKEIDWALYKNDGIKSVILFAIVIFIAVILSIKLKREKLKRYENIFSVCFILLMIETLFVAMIKYDGFSVKTEVVCTTESEWNYSSDENFIIIVLDSFDSRMLDSLLKSEYSDEVRNNLKDFVFCRDTVSLFGMTDYSLLQIITGKEYLCEKAYDDFCTEAYDDSYLLKRLNEDNYDIGIYANNAIPADPKHAKNWYRVKYGVDSHSKLLGYLYKFVGFRYLPYQLKKYCWFYPDDMDSLKLISYLDDQGNDVNGELFDWANYVFNEDMYKINVATEKKCFRLYHLKGTHPLRNYTRDFVLSEDEVGFEETALACVDMMGRYFDKLREMGAYDNSNILIIADHGEALYGDEDNGYRNSPILLYKGKGEHGDLKIDESPCTFERLEDLYSDILNVDATNINAVNVLKDEDRYTYNIIWAGHPTAAHSSVGGFERVNVTGPAYDTGAYTLTDEKHLLEE